MTSSSEKTPTVSAFFYGTLMAPEVFFTVCYRNDKPSPDILRQYTFHPAVLSAYTRHRVRHADYPGIVSDNTAGAAVRGVLATGLTETNLRDLDIFEGSSYERRTVEVTLTDPDGQADKHGPRVAKALVYVFKHPASLEPREWDFEEFRRDKMHYWAKADYAFEDCDPDDPATVAS